MLGWFKYYGFFVTSVVNFLGALHLNADLPLLRIVLPLGISFLTFRVLSYVIDVYRGTLRPASLLDFSVYVAFFPYLAAGPIARASEFLPQLNGPRDPRNVDTARAFFLIFGGLIKKMLIADYLATHIVNGVFTTPGQYSSLEVLLGIIGYAVQIYCDFSAYADIAIGISLLLGFELPDNFDAPYTARSVQDFWRRWHMTLSRWLRDYLYIPLGGNRKGRSAHLREPDAHHGARRALARRRLDVHLLGLPLRRRPDRRARARRPPQGARAGRAAPAPGAGGGLRRPRRMPAPLAGGPRRGPGRRRAAARVRPAAVARRLCWPRIGVFAFVTFAWIFFRSDSLRGGARASSPGCSRAGARSAPPSPRACSSPSPSASACSTCRARCGSAVRPASRS